MNHAISPSSLTLSIILLSYLNFISVSICEVMCVFMCSLECIIGVKHQIMVPDLTLYMIWSTDILCREHVRWFITHRSYTRTGHGSSQSVPQLHLWRFTNRSLKRVGSLDRTGISEWFIHQEKPIGSRFSQFAKHSICIFECNCVNYFLHFLVKWCTLTWVLFLVTASCTSDFWVQLYYCSLS